MISFDEARNTILSTVQPLEATRVSLRDALGRIAAETIVADAEAVPFPRSAMDGYAVRKAECSHATREHPVELPLAGIVFAEQAESTLAPGTALAISTGAPLPDGADAVIPYEQIERHDNRIRVFAPVASGACVFPPGEDIRRGDELVASGESLSAGKLALLAFAGRTHLRVFQRPRVAVLCNGQELVDPGITPGHGQVRNSNSFALFGLLTEFGGVPHDHGTAPDDPTILSAMLESARHDSDLIVTTGGASSGERDLVKNVLKDLGAKFLFEQVAMRPGKPFGFAIWHGKPVCVLPGTPAAAFVCFQELARSAVVRLAGRQETSLPVVRARLQRSLHSRTERRYFVLARLDLAPDGFAVTPLDNQCSALVRTAADANAIIVVRETSTGGASRMNSGELVDVEVFEWPRVLVVGDNNTQDKCVSVLLTEEDR
ncbi:MAG TPA: gephyrin-like molybdotransferase Glp [Candidatus Acidoferrales bacterium]|nr:gephyrin-like molybdotransferase Glp [Candidatus Acidoferrales bacterium]